MFDKILEFGQLAIKVITFIIVEVVPFGRAVQKLFKKKDTNGTD
jgi:hypothetical protein